MSTDACDGCPYVLPCWAGQLKTGTTTYDEVTVMSTACGHTMIYAWKQQQWLVLRSECPRGPDLAVVGSQRGCPRCDPDRWMTELLRGRDLRFIAEE